MNKSSDIGWVAGLPIPEFIREINAFYRVARSVIHHAEEKVGLIGSWYDPAKVPGTTDGCVASGADIIKHVVVDPAPILVAGATGIKSIGFQIDQDSFELKNCLTSTMITWRTIYASSVQKVLDGAWKPEEN